MPNASAAPDIRRILVVRNPASTRAATAIAYIATLRSLAEATGRELTVLETSAAGRAANKALLQAHASWLGPKTLLCIAAGDGTVNLLVEALLTDPALPAQARKTIILPLWGGNANDLAHMLNGAVRRTSLRHILEHGVTTAVQPLECRLTAPDGKQEIHLATCYASFGASAFAAHRLAEPAMRHHPLDVIPGGRAIKELATVIKALMDAPEVTVHEGTRSRNMYEHIFIKGSRFAKVRGINLQLTAPHFYHTVLRAKRARTLFFHIWRLTAPRAVQRVAGNYAAFTPMSTLWAQVDGEVFAISGGTTIEVRLSPQPVYLLSTRLTAGTAKTGAPKN